MAAEDIGRAFEAYGEVHSANIIKDEYSGQSGGLDFAEMPNTAEAQTAIENLNGKDLLGRQMNVNEARPRADRARPGGQGGHGERSRFGGGRRY